MTVTVGFDATAALRQSAGIGRYTRELLAALARRTDDTRYRLFGAAGGEARGSMPALDARFSLHTVPVGDRITNALWHRARLPIPVQAVTGRFDLFHSPDFTLPPVAGAPSILTVHDLAFLTVPECAYPTLRAYLERVVPRSARRATRIIAVSHCTRDDLVRLLDISPGRVTVIHEGVDDRFHPPVDPGADAALLQRLRVDRPYILAVGTLEPRKNYPRLLEAYARLREQGRQETLVIAGARGWMYEPFFERLDELKLRDHVRVVRPNDEELIALYGNAEVFAYPSLYEGFGIPPLEAMACGTPVVCSSTSSLPEVVGEDALTVDPTSPEEIALALYDVLTNPDLRDRLRTRGPQRAARFTWDEAARATHDLYLEVARG